MNIATILDMAAEAFGERTALVCGSTRMSYAELRAAARHGAGAIRGSKAAYAALLDVNSPAAPVAIFAAAYAGVPYVPLNYRLSRPEINELVARIAPAYLITSGDYHALLDRRDDVQVVDRAAFLDLPESLAADLPEPG
ncbi:MAG: AMP-binding protein, partial [Nevskia sp.]|nr:AMP-binding protein [Nevskia sp.]